MSSIPSESLSLLVEAILCLGTGMSLPPSMTDALRALSPAGAVAAEATISEPAVEPVVEAPVLAPVKEKKVSKTSAAVAAAAAAAAGKAVTGGDPWRTHPSRLAVIDPKCCVGRRINEKNPLAGTRPGDAGSNRGKVFPETQCISEPVPGSKLCAGCAKKDAAFKADPNTKDESWYGRLDEESLYPRAKIVGCKYFLDKYPNGIHNDSFRPGATSTIPAVAPVAPVAAVAAVPEPKAVGAKRGPKKAAAATTAAADTATPVTSKSVAADIAPVNANYKTFMYEGRLHIRNLETHKVYYADMAKSSPEENAVKEQYVGRWVDGSVDLVGDSDEE